MEMTVAAVRSLYWESEWSIAMIAAFVGKSDETVRRFMAANGIPRRPKTHRFGGWNKGQPMPDEQRAKLSATRTALYASGELRHWNEGRHWPVEIREKISAGVLAGREPAPSYYGPDWQRQRTSALQRDGYACQQCGSIDSIEVHHWEPYRFSFDNSLDNLVVLCADCHIDMHVRYRREGFIAMAEAEQYA